MATKSERMGIGLGLFGLALGLVTLVFPDLTKHLSPELHGSVLTLSLGLVGYGVWLVWLKRDPEQASNPEHVSKYLVENAARTEEDARQLRTVEMTRLKRDLAGQERLAAYYMKARDNSRTTLDDARNRHEQKDEEHRNALEKLRVVINDLEGALLPPYDFKYIGGAMTRVPDLNRVAEQVSEAHRIIRSYRRQEREEMLDACKDDPKWFAETKKDIELAERSERLTYHDPKEPE
jgi:hypothetical protein